MKEESSNFSNLYVDQSTQQQNFIKGIYKNYMNSE